MKNISILGSTGSIGTQTLDIIRNNPKEFKAVGLAANSNIGLLKKQIDDFNVGAVAVMDREKAELLKEKTNINVYSGIEGIMKIAALSETDTVVNSLVGSIGIKPTIGAIKNKKNIALANKETLVAAGSIVMQEAEKNNVKIMPIDSEHSAIFQCIEGKGIEQVKKIIITASGGPFRDYTKEKLKNIKVKDALRHPTWKMGNKITIDSATLMNKGFEVIEAHWLYNIPYEKIEIIVHPQSIIHSLVEFKDNSTLAQLSFPDMRIPIQYALSYPKRLESKAKEMKLAEIKELTFEKPNFELFPCLKYAYDAGIRGGTLPAVLNAANEVAVNNFLEGRIKFIDIPKTISNAMESHKIIKNPSLNQILNADKNARIEAEVTANTDLSEK
ncbi:1-deoxy-D-xylulose-5-phosphate reductoisomerase [Candidatus Woesearchaeota archaeon]|nr:1-deoxy-D-xylulose-5-phosphate reductoisomerase [Candidatus Woesearchaeota archaeon]